MLTISVLQGANQVELERIARTEGLDMTMIFAVGREQKSRVANPSISWSTT
jgi:hypothetical protein